MRDILRRGLFPACLALVVACAMGCIARHEIRGTRQANAADTGRKLRVAVLTGGHGFDHKSFFGLFEGFSDVIAAEVALKKDSAIFDDVSHWPYDVIVMYNMTQQITEKQRGNFFKLLDRGVGLVALHHCVGAYQDWDEYPKIIGGRYYTRPTVVDGQTVASRFAEGVSIAVHVADAGHPVTAGLRDFVVRDEVYSNCHFEPDNTYLLTTDHEKSDKKLAWVRTYRKSHVCCILLGHGTTIFSDSAYQRLVHNAILWAVKRPGVWSSEFSNRQQSPKCPE